MMLKKVIEIISAGLRNMNYTDFYKNLADDESEVREDEYIADSSSEPLTMLLNAMRKKQYMRFSVSSITMSSIWLQ